VKVGEGFEKEIEVEAGESGDCGAENPLMAFTWGAL